MSDSDLTRIVDATGAVTSSLVDLVDRFDRGLEAAFHRFLTAFGMAVVATTLVAQLAGNSLSGGEFAAALAAGVILAITGTAFRAILAIRAAQVHEDVGKDLFTLGQDLIQQGAQQKGGAGHNLTETAR